MVKRQKGHCVQCGHNAGEEHLSKQKLCYDCAKERMIRNFDLLWFNKERG